MDTTCRTLRTTLGTGQIGFSLSQTKSKLGIFDDNKCITFLHLLKFTEAYLAYKPLHTAVLWHYILAYMRIIRDLATTEMHKLTGGINGATCYTEYHNSIITIG